MESSGSSVYYDQFTEEQKVELNAYEKAAIWAYKFLKVNWANPKFDREMEDVDLFVRFKHASSLGLLVGLLTLPLSVLIFLVGKNSITNWTAILLPLVTAFTAGYIPAYIARLRKMKIIGQGPLAMLYLVIAMEVTPILNQA